MAVKRKKKILRIRKMNSRVAKVVGVLVLIAVTLFILMLTPLFDAKYLTVKSSRKGDLQKVTTGDVKQALDYDSSINIFKYNLGDAERKLEKNPFVKKVVMERNLPDEICVTVTERLPVAYIKTGKVAFLLDEEGVLLEQVGKVPAGLPAVVGMPIKSLKIGQALSEADTAKSNAYTALYTKLKEYELIDQTTEINIQNPDYMECTMNRNKRVIFGDGYQLDYKMRLLQVAMDRLAPSEAGTITLTVEGEASFSPKEE